MNKGLSMEPNVSSASSYTISKDWVQIALANVSVVSRSGTVRIFYALFLMLTNGNCKSIAFHGALPMKPF